MRSSLTRFTIIVTFLLLAPLLFVSANEPQKTLLLIDANITPRIVVPAVPTETEEYAAGELAAYLGKITGKMPAVISSDAPPTAEGSPLIILGNHPLNADLEPQKLGIEESLISVEPGRLRITGGFLPPLPLANGNSFVRERGTLYGVYHFLNDLGVHWYRPDPWGEHVPQLAKIELPQGRRSFKPVYKYRMSTNLYTSSREQTAEQAQWGVQWALRNFINVNLAAGSKRGGTYAVRIQHNYNNLLSPRKYFKTNPEYFALIDGQRSAKGQPCLGNPKVQQIMADAAIDLARRNPHFETISVEPNDGAQFWCECELCRALDDPTLKARNGGVARLGNASMTNRVAFVNNFIAKRLGEEVPGMRVAWYAYLGHSEVPTKVTALEPNIYVAPTTMAAAYGNYSRLLHDPKAAGNANFLELLEGWGKHTGLVTREYWAGTYWYGPTPMQTVLKDRLTQYRKYNVQGVINESSPSWGPHVDLFYFLARLQWNPDLDMDKELEQFCRNYYGPAAKPMQEYYRVLEEGSLKGPAWHFLGRFIDRLFTDDELIERMTGHITEAQKLVQGQPVYERRFKGAWAGYEVARLRNQLERYKRANNPAQALATWHEMERFITSDTTGEWFNAGPRAFRVTWRVLAEQIGIKALQNQLTTLKATPGARISQNLSEGWKFDTDPQSDGLARGVQGVAFADANWPVVHTNSPWQDQGHNFQGTAWYRKAVQLEKKVEGKKYALFFGAVDGDAVIYVNGHKAGEHLLAGDSHGWNKDFMIDITEQVKNGENHIAIQVTKKTNVGGIFKGVLLMEL